MKRVLVMAVVVVSVALGGRAHAAPGCALSDDALGQLLDELKRARAQAIADANQALLANKAADAHLKLEGALETQLSQLRQRKPSRELRVRELTRVSIQLSSIPATRLRVSFDAPNGLHHEVEWDPAVSSTLQRHVSLEEAAWTVSVSTEPQPFTQQSGVVMIQTEFSALQRVLGGDPIKFIDNRAVIEGTAIAMSASGSAKISDAAEMKTWPQPRLTFDCQASQLSIEQTQFSAQATVGANGPRGMGVAPTFVAETLALLTEIAVERAKAGALRLIKRRLVDPFCTGASRITLESLRLTRQELAFPRTCALLEGLRLEDILSSGRALLSALRDDLRQTIAPAAITKLSGAGELAAPALRAVLSVLSTAVERGGFDGLEGQLALELVGSFKRLTPQLPPAMAAKLDGLLPAAAKSHFAALKGLRLGEWVDTPSSAAIVTAAHGVDEVKELLGYACQARLVVAVIKRCNASPCSVGELASSLEAPESWFAEEKTLPHSLCWTGGKYLRAEGEAAAAQQLVVDGLKALAPVADPQGRDRAKAMVRLLVALVKHWKGAQADAKALERLDALAETAVALIDEDYGTALTRALALLPATDRPEALTEMTKIFGSVAAYASVYKATKDEDPKEAREARKKALISIIDAATDRSDRAGDLIVSLGSNVGFSASWSDPAFTERGETLMTPGLRVPLGVRVEWLRKPKVHDSVHLGMQVFDLGQFVRRDDQDGLGEVQWADFVAPGIELGLGGLFGDNALNVSLHGSYAPSLEQPGSGEDKTYGVWRFGFALSYYVPFFDFN